MANSIEFAKRYTGILDEVYQRAAVSGCLDSGRNMVRAGRNAKEILIPKIEVTGLGDYTRNVGYKTGSITWAYETHTFGYDRAIRLFADVMDIEEGGILDAFAEFGCGESNGFKLGDFEVRRFAEDDAASGEGMATRAALRELAGTGMVFAGVR